MQYYQVLISAEQTTQGLRILEHLMAKQLVLGGPVFNGPSKFLWNFKASAVPQGMQKDGLYIDEHDYCFAITYTREDLEKQLIEEAEKASVEEVCMISFIPMEGNSALIELLEGMFAGRETATSPPEPDDAVAALTFVPESGRKPVMSGEGRISFKNNRPRSVSFSFQTVYSYVSSSPRKDSISGSGSISRSRTSINVKYSIEF